MNLAPPAALRRRTGESDARTYVAVAASAPTQDSSTSTVSSAATARTDPPNDNERAKRPREEPEEFDVAGDSDHEQEEEKEEARVDVDSETEVEDGKAGASDFTGSPVAQVSGRDEQLASDSGTAVGGLLDSEIAEPGADAIRGKKSPPKASMAAAAAVTPPPTQPGKLIAFDAEKLVASPGGKSLVASIRKGVKDLAEKEGMVFNDQAVPSVLEVIMDDLNK